MSDSKNNSSQLLVVALVLAVIAGLAYFSLSEKTTEEAGTEQAATTEQPAASTAPSTEQPAEPQPVVLETKTLKLPAAAAPTIPVAEASKDPAVEAMMGVRKLGSDDAPIKVVEYSSLTCGHCSAFHKNDLPKIKADFIDTGKVQFIFKEFPLNPPAVDASKLLRCMPEDKFVTFMSLLFDEQEKWAYTADYITPLKQNAKLAGLSDEQVESCLGNKELQARLIGDMKAATDKFQIQSTPTFIINDGVKTIVGHQPIEFVEGVFNDILSGKIPATKAAADEGTKKEEVKE